MSGNPVHPVNRVFVIGVGPGTADYLTPVARACIEGCDLLLGSPRLTRLFPQESRPLDFRGDPPASVKYILENRSRQKIGVLVSGDPGLYSFLGVISRYLPPEDYEVMPGISSVQLAFARLKESWADALILSLHGRQETDLARKVAAHPKVAILTDPSHPPQAIARALLAHGLKGREFIICQDLSYPEERIVRTTLEEAAQLPLSGSLLVIIQEKAP